MILVSSIRCIVLSQIQRVLSGTRRNSQLYYLNHHKNHEHTTSERKSKDMMLEQFNTLRNIIQKAPVDKKIPSKDIFDPFLMVVRSENINASLTRVALEAIHALLSRCLVICDPSDPSSIDTLTDVVESIIGCRFTSTTPSDDQAVLLLIVEILVNAFQSPVGRVLSDHLVWGMVETVYGLSCTSKQQIKIPVILSNVASTYLHEICRTIFSECESFEDSIGSSSRYGLICAVKIFGFLCQRIKQKNEYSNEEVELCLRLLHCCIEAAGSSLSKCTSLMALVKDDICETIVLRGRLGCKSPTNIIFLCLQITRLLWTYVRQYLKMQLEAIMNGVFIHALHWVVNLISLNGVEDANVQEDYIAAQEILECLVDFLSETTLLTDFYINYDCDARRSDVTESIFSLLRDIVVKSRRKNEEIKNKDTSQVQIIGSIALNGLFASIWVLYQRFHQDIDLNESNDNADEVTVGTDGCLHGFESAEEMWKRRQHKMLLVEGSNIFNDSAKKGLMFLQKNGILPSPLDCQSVSDFLRSLPPGLDKKSVGEYLGTIGKAEENAYEGDTVEFHQQVLSSFIESFDFRGQTLLDSLRMFLTSFRLPGEAQQIDRILNCFSNAVYQKCSDCAMMASVDVAYLLSFSIILLNTDLHNPNIRPEKKMKLEGFFRNNINYGEEVSKGMDLPLDYLESIYVSILNEEIRTCSDIGASGEVTSDRWKDLLRQSETDPFSAKLIGYSSPSRSSSFHDNNKTASDLKTMKNNTWSIYDAQIFDILWNKLLEAFSSLFHEYNPDFLDVKQLNELHVAVNGFVLCGATASHLSLHEQFNEIFKNLCQFTTLLQSNVKNNNSTHNPDALSKFYTNKPAQLATVSMLTLVHVCPNSLREGWKYFFQCLMKLREFCVLPNCLLQSSSFYLLKLKERQKFISNIENETRNRLTKSGKLKTSTDSFFNAFSSYIVGKNLSNSTKTSTQSTYPDLSTSVEDLIDFKFSSYDENVNQKNDISSNENKNDLCKRESREWVRNSLQSFHLESFLKDIQSIDMETLASLIQNLIERVEAVFIPPQRRSKSNLLSSSSLPIKAGGSVFCEHLIIEIMLVHTRHENCKHVWDLFHQHVHNLMEKLKPLIVGNLVVNGMDYELSMHMLDTCISGMIQLQIQKQIHQTSNDLEKILFLLVHQMERNMMELVFAQIINGFFLLFSNPNSSIHLSRESWDSLFQLLTCSTSHSFVCFTAFQTLQAILDKYLDQNFCPFEAIYKTLICFALSGQDETMIRLPALETMKKTTFERFQLMSLQKDKDISKDHEITFLQLIGSFIACCKDFNLSFRHQALITLQDILFQQDIQHFSALCWKDIIYHGLIPLLSYFSKGVCDTNYFSFPKINDSSLVYYFPPWKEDVSTHSISLKSIILTIGLISKIYLHHLESFYLQQLHGEIWYQILSIYSQCLLKLFSSNVEDSSLLKDSIHQHVKNILLVLSSFSDFDMDDKSIWSHTWKLIEKSHPQLLIHLFPGSTPSKFSPDESISTSSVTSSTTLKDSISINAMQSIVQSTLEEIISISIENMINQQDE